MVMYVSVLMEFVLFCFALFCFVLTVIVWLSKFKREDFMLYFSFELFSEQFFWRTK